MFKSRRAAERVRDALYNKGMKRLLITMGDVAGIGPEIIARAWPELTTVCRPLIVGDLLWLERALAVVGSRATVCPVRQPAEAEATPDRIPCLIGSTQDLSQVEPGRVCAAA